MYQNLTISPVIGPDGNVNKICLMIYDVTDIASSRMALEQANKELGRLSMTDGLTGLLNRGTWENHIDAEFERHRRYGHESALVMFDIDHFKPVNDTYGHLAGDEVIKHTAQIIRDNLRSSDRAGRYGGEEFGIILPETNAEGARVICERIRETIENATVQTDAAPIQYTISMGIAPLTNLPDNICNGSSRPTRRCTPPRRVAGTRCGFLATISSPEDCPGLKGIRSGSGFLTLYTDPLGS